MKKLVKFLTLLTALVMLASVVCAFPCSAATSFTKTDKNFRPVFDFDTVPGTYAAGNNKVGTRTDTVGDSKSEKCIDAQGIGLSYNLEIVKGKTVSNNGLKLTVTDLSPEDGAYCPISFNVRYGTKKLVNVYGATDFMFWCDTTGFKDGYANQKGIILYVQEANVLPDGSTTSEAATAWKPKAGTKGGYYLYENGKGGWTKQATNETDFYLPVNYRGWIKMPMSAFTYCDWNGDTVNDRFYGKQIQVVQFGMGNYKRQSGSVIYFDEIGFTGSFKESAYQTTTSSKPQSTNSNKPQGTTSSKPQGTASTTPAGTSSDTSADTSSVLDEDSQNQVSVDDSNSGNTTDVESMTDTEAGDKDDVAETSKATNEAKQETTKGIIIGVAISVCVVALAGIGVAAWFLISKKKKNG